jgi:rhamnogalacturonan endolyase
MAKWGGTHTVSNGSNNNNGFKDFPMALFAKTGGPAHIIFTLSKEQAAAGALLRVGTTLAFKGGRPKPTIGSWTGPAPKEPRNLNSRGITRGGYRGLGETYEFNVPASALVAGRNTLTLGVYGNGDEAFLSANYVLDAIELVGRRS